MRAVLLTMMLSAAAVICRADSGELALTIAPAEATLKRGEQLKVEATITNSGPSPVTLVLPGDGSQVGWRTPVVTWVFVPEGTLLPHAGSSLDADPICGNINAFKRSEVFTLPPSATRVLNEWINPVVDLPAGRYRLRMRYSNEPARKTGGLPLGAHEAGAEDLIRRSTACMLVSNDVSLTVVE